jgi:hypothetical protein
VKADSGPHRLFVVVGCSEAETLVSHFPATVGEPSTALFLGVGTGSWCGWVGATKSSILLGI